MTIPRTRGASWVTVPTWVWRLWTDSRLWLLTCPCEVQVFAVSDLFLLPPTLARQDPVMLGRCPSRNFSDENWAVFAEEESDRDTRSVMNNQLTDFNVSHWPHESKSEWQLLASGGVSICPYLTVVGRQDRLSHYSQRNWSDQWPPPGRSLYKGWTITPNTYTYIPTYPHYQPPSKQPAKWGVWECVTRILLPPSVPVCWSSVLSPGLIVPRLTFTAPAQDHLMRRWFPCLASPASLFNSVQLGTSVQWCTVVYMYSEKCSVSVSPSPRTAEVWW